MSRARQREKQKEKRRRREADPPAAAPNRGGVWEAGIRSDRAIGTSLVPGADFWVCLVATGGNGAAIDPIVADSLEEAVAAVCSVLLVEVGKRRETAPRGVEVNHRDLVDAIGALSVPFGEVTLRPKLPRLDRRLAEAAEEAVRGKAPVGAAPASDRDSEDRSVFNGEGAGREEVAFFVAAAERFALAERWESVPRGMLLEVLDPAPPEGAAIVCLDPGEGGHDPPKVVFWGSEERMAEGTLSGRCDWGLAMTPLLRARAEDVNRLLELGLSPGLAGAFAFVPALIGFDDDGTRRTASGEELEAFARILMSLATMVASSRGTGDEWEGPMEIDFPEAEPPFNARFRPVG